MECFFIGKLVDVVPLREADMVLRTPLYNPNTERGAIFTLHRATDAESLSAACDEGQNEGLQPAIRHTRGKGDARRCCWDSQWVIAHEVERAMSALIE